MNFLDRFFKNTLISNIMKTRSSGRRVVPCGRTDRQTDMTELIFAFLNFARAPKKLYIYLTLGHKWLKCYESIAVNEICNLLVFYPV